MSLDTVSDNSIIRKLDRNIIPLVMALYLFSFLDRVNIGNARLYGLEEDLGLSPRQWQVAVSILFVTYIVSSLHRIYNSYGRISSKIHPRYDMSWAISTAEVLIPRTDIRDTQQPRP